MSHEPKKIIVSVEVTIEGFEGAPAVCYQQTAGSSSHVGKEVLGRRGRLEIDVITSPSPSGITIVTPTSAGNFFAASGQYTGTGQARTVYALGFPNTSAYSLVKGAILTLTKVLAAELGPRNVRVNALSPGSVPTPGALGLNDRAEYERRTRTIPLRRLGREEDHASAVAFLLSPQASFINGEILHVDGGIAAAG